MRAMPPRSGLRGGARSKISIEPLDAAGFHGDPIGFVLSTPCSLAVVNQEDLTGETDQQNLPASTWQYPNWRRKMKIAVEDLSTLEASLRGRIERSGRHG